MKPMNIDAAKRLGLFYIASQEDIVYTSQAYLFQRISVAPQYGTRLFCLSGALGLPPKITII